MKKLIILISVLFFMLLSINNVDSASEESTTNNTKIEEVLKKLERLNIKTLLKAVEKIDLIILKYKEEGRNIKEISDFKLKIVQIVESKTGKTKEELELLDNNLKKLKLEDLQKLNNNFDILYKKYGKSEESKNLLNFLKSKISENIGNISQKESVNTEVVNNDDFKICDKGTDEEKLKCLITNIGNNNELLLNNYKIRKNTCKTENNCLLFLEGEKNGNNFLVAPVETEKKVIYRNVKGVCGDLEIKELGFSNKGKWKITEESEMKILSNNIKNRDFKYENYWITENPTLGTFGGRVSNGVKSWSSANISGGAWDLLKSKKLSISYYSDQSEVNIDGEGGGVSNLLCYLPLDIKSEVNKNNIDIPNIINFSKNIIIGNNIEKIECGGKVIKNRGVIFSKELYQSQNGVKQEWSYSEAISKDDTCKWTCDKGYKKHGSTCITDYKVCKGTLPKESKGLWFTNTEYQKFDSELSWSFSSKGNSYQANSCSWGCYPSYKKNGNTCKSTFDKNTHTTSTCNDTLFMGSDIRNYGTNDNVMYMTGNNTGYVCRTPEEGGNHTLMKNGKCLVGLMDDKNLINIGERSTRDNKLSCTKNGFVNIDTQLNKATCNSDEIQVYKANTYTSSLYYKICIPKTSKVCEASNGQIYAAISNYKYSESETTRICNSGTYKGKFKGKIIGGNNFSNLNTNRNCNNDFISSRANERGRVISLALDSKYKCRYSGSDENYTLLNSALTECYEARTKSSTDNTMEITKTIKIGEAYSASLVCTKNGFAKFNSNPTKCPKGKLLVSEYYAGTMCVGKNDVVCKANNGKIYAVKRNYIYNKEDTLKNCKKYNNEIISDLDELDSGELANKNIDKSCDDNHFQGIKLDRNYKCRYSGSDKAYTLMSSNLSECYRARMYPGKNQKINIIGRYKIYDIFSDKLICTKNGFADRDTVKCGAGYIKIDRRCISKSTYICKTNKGTFDFSSRENCIEKGGRPVLASKYKVDKNISSSCNNDQMIGIAGSLGKSFRCSNSDGGDTQTLMNAEKTKCYKLVGSDLSKAVPYNIGDKLDIHSYNSGFTRRYMCTQNGFTPIFSGLESCQKGMKIVEYTTFGESLPSFRGTEYTCVPNNFITCKVDGEEYIGDSKKGTKEYCEYKGGDFFTPNETDSCNDNNFNGKELAEDLICRIPIAGGEATIMNKDGTKCKYGDNWYRVGQTFNHGIGEGKKYYKCTAGGVNVNEEDVFVDESIFPEDNTESYTNYLCDNSNIFGTPLGENFLCKSPLGTVSYTIMTDPGLSCMNVSLGKIKELGSNNPLSEEEKKDSLKKVEDLDKNIELYDNGLKDFDNQVKDKPEKERQAIKRHWKMKLDTFISLKDKEIKGSGMMSRDLLQGNGAISIGHLGENDTGLGSFGVCTTAGLFGEGGAGGGAGTISVKKGDTKKNDNFLQYVKDDSCDGKFILEREVSGIIINKMEIKASCEDKDSKQDGPILKECKEWGGSGIYDRFITLEKQKKPSCEKPRSSAGPDASEEELEAVASVNEAAAEAEADCKEDQEKQIKEWEEKIAECLDAGEEGEESNEGEESSGSEEGEEEKKGYSPEPKRKKLCYINNPYPFEQKIYNYKAVCETKYGSFDEDLVKITEVSK